MSVTESGAKLLDAAESTRRRRLNIERYRKDVDDRQVCPIDGASRTPRPGYDNADPWYDGRDFNYTIVDAPNSGTCIPFETIVEIATGRRFWEGSTGARA